VGPHHRPADGCEPSFYRRLNQLLREHDFDDFVEAQCASFYAGTVGRPSLPPGIYFRLLLIGCFEGIDSERGIAWRAADSLALRDFLGLGLGSRGPTKRPNATRGSEDKRRRICVLSCVPVGVRLSSLLAATLLALCVGLQVLEATGQWDRTLQDSADEAIIVTVVLCIGSSLVAARIARYLVSVMRSKRGIVLVAAKTVVSIVPTTAAPAFSTSPPISLRI